MAGRVGGRPLAGATTRSCLAHHLAARFRPDFSRGALWEPNPAVAGQGNGEAARQRDRQACQKLAH